MNHKRKHLFLGLIFGIIVTCFIALMIWYQFRGSVKVIPGEDMAGAEPVFFSQKDIQWAKDYLGDSGYTMESSGCLVTCIAAAMQMSDNITGGDESMDWMKDPGALNQYFSQNHVYDSQGNLQWKQLEELEYFHVDVNQEVSAQIIQEYLQVGRYPIVRVRMNGYGSFHYVLIVTSQNGRFYCIDPMNPNEELLPLSKYNNRVYAIRCVYPGPAYSKA
ncbi:MAG: hypothetical protein ACRDBO_09840 [Lachnospiraceae bacterium]